MLSIISMPVQQFRQVQQYRAGPAIHSSAEAAISRGAAIPSDSRAGTVILGRSSDASISQSRHQHEPMLLVGPRAGL